MTHTTGPNEALSRSSDHLGNLANILKDLGGGATLLNELTQNANDAAADSIRFTASEDELAVWNSAVFSDCGQQQERRTCPWRDAGRRSCDLHSFRLVAGRHKSDDDSTTGAFGVGFTAVYQVTDHPELVTAGWHLILNELQPEDRRIRVCSGGCSRDHEQPGTTFHLPWARSDSELRRALGATPLAESEVSALIAQMIDGAAPALIFLERLRSLEFHASGRRTVVTRSKQADRITIEINGTPSEWLLLGGQAEGAAELKAHFGESRSDRSPRVQVAVPIDAERVGRVFADLPTETRTGWTGHVNGTFFPRQDRKTVEFGGQGFRGRWNDLLIETAARITAEHLEEIADALGERVAWRYLVAVEQINRDIARDEYPAPFSAFFTHAKSAATDASIALLADGRRVTPRGVLVPRDDHEYQAADALTKLDLTLLHPSIRPEARQISRTQYGMSDLAVDDVVDALNLADVTGPWIPSNDSLLAEDDVEAVLQLIESLQARGKALLTNALAGEVAIVPCLDGSFAPATEVANLGDDDRALFELLAPDLKILDENRLQNLCPSLITLCDDITPSRAIEIFEADTDALAVAPDEVLDWLANHRSALATDEVRTRVRALPVYPSTSGELLPLTDLSLPSDFDDVLGVADVVNREKTTGYEDLLQLLGARKLDAVEYLERHVVPAARAGELSDAQAVAVLEIIDRHQVDLDQSGATRAALANTPLVATDQGLKSAREAHLPNRALALIDPDAPTAVVDGLPSHLIDTLVWLGVSRTPNDTVLNSAALRLGQDSESPVRDVVLAILDSLPNPPDTDKVPESLSALTTSPWLPIEGGRKARPREAYAVFQRYLFETQGPHLDLPRADQQRLSLVLDWLSVPSTPTTAMVVAHLRNCAEHGIEVNEQVYRFLGDAKNERAVQALRDFACVQISKGEFVNPDAVFWTDPQLGQWAHHLPPSHRQYQAFYDRVGVEESPSPGQLERVLRRIARAFMSEYVEGDDQAVVHRCWELLDEQLPASNEALERLRPVKSALGPRGLLEKPELLLFADGRRLAETIPLIKDNLIHRDRTTRRALAAAGVRPVEEVIEPRVDPTLAVSPADRVAALIRDRNNALARLVDAQRSDEVDYEFGTLTDLRYDHMPDLSIEYVTRFAHQHWVDEPRSAEAIYLSDEHRLIVRNQAPTRHLARELALCIAPDADVSTMAPSILEILRAESLTEAMNVLDEYGVRDLDVMAWEAVKSNPADNLSESTGTANANTDHELDENAAETGRSTAGTSDLPDTSDAPEQGGVEDLANGVGSPAQHDGAGQGARTSDSHGGTAAGRERPPRRRSDRQRVPNTSRLTSYVSFGDSEHESDGGDEAQRSSAIDKAGVRHVIEFERSCGRFPEEQTHTNPGFDVLSRNRDGVVLRRIEIKSIGGPWSDRGVLLSSTQFADAQANPDLYWLYVVEHAQDDDTVVIHRIKDPAGQVTKFAFDKGWQALDEPEVSRDASGQPTVQSTRGLLGWSAGLQENGLP
ncbi:DUF3883 domain-containing protein [Myceligenerans indicum]|uniref:DUF3883 domain-containing protein n=1 Tax=Myceligenerans indicum TaxID=2593663 RepID=A0ABS1LK41_9MICO|nr:DUF3883 domain-containing protein [Myceligenerans indicum]MBL0886389.1 DUF3883 domain-containing protein [Myceligenerans indicum]